MSNHRSDVKLNFVQVAAMDIDNRCAAQEFLLGSNDVTDPFHIRFPANHLKAFSQISVTIAGSSSPGKSFLTGNPFSSSI